MARERYQRVRIPDFSGGLNVRDSLIQLAANETPDCWNVVLDERGGGAARLGYVKWNASAAASLITYGAESKVAGKLLWYTQADGKLYSDPGTGVLTLRRTWTAGSPIQIADFAGKVYAIHPVDGLYSSTDGVTWTIVTAASGSIPASDQLQVFQNKLWVALSTSNLLSFSAPGDPTKWATADGAGSNYIREGNDFPIVCLYGATGSDFQTKPSLLIGKRSGGSGSLHRVTDAATGNYITLDQQVGPAGPNAVESYAGIVYFVSTAGIFGTDGLTAPKPVGGKLEPLFRPGSLDFTKAAGFCAGREKDRLVFSVARAGATANDLALQYQNGGFTARSDAAACYVTYTSAGEKLIAASPTVVGQLYQMNTGGSDDGAAIHSWLTTRVFEPDGGSLGRLQHVRPLAHGEFTIKAMKNGERDGPDKPLAILAQGDVWGSGAWGTFVWGEDIIGGYADFWPRMVGRSFQVRVEATSTSTTSRPPLLTSGTATAAGAWSLYALELEITPLRPS